MIDNGFYYDFSYKRPFTPEDLAAIEKKMAETGQKDEVVTREEWSRDDAVEFFKGIGEKYKAEIIASIPSNETLSLYREGRVHRPVSRPARAVHGQAQGLQADEGGRRLLARRQLKERDAPAHLRHGLGHQDEQDACTCWKEAERRDHRKIGRELDLFHFQDEAPA